MDAHFDTSMVETTIYQTIRPTVIDLRGTFRLMSGAFQKGAGKVIKHIQLTKARDLPLIVGTNGLDSCQIFMTV